MNINNTEIERKYLIAMPRMEYLTTNGSATEITQTYLKSEADAMSERVRKRGCNGSWEYTHTCKRKINNLRREEIERIISEDEYNKLLKRADTSRRSIEKTRWCIAYNNQLLEIDIFPFWDDRAFLEIELQDEAQTVFLPAEIKLIKEVTDDKRYTNSTLAKQIITEEIV